MRPPRQGSTLKVFDHQVVLETEGYTVAVPKKGYVSGVGEGSFVDRKTGARDLGFGLDVVDFLLEPADPSRPVPDGQYDFGPTNEVHGNIPKRYVEGPQICTQAKTLEPKIHEGPGFTAITQRYSWSVPYAPRERAGSMWEQMLIFPHRGRHFLAADRVTVANNSAAMTLRIDLPGHIKHERGDKFEHVYLSYGQPKHVPSTEFATDFPPDARFLYTRGVEKLPERFIRAYQADLGPGRGEGPWLAGMTLNPADVSQAWCHQRGYVCLIQEIGGRPVKPGDTFGAAYVIGWFDDVAEMERVYDQHRGVSGFALEGTAGHRGLKAGELTAIRPS